MFSIEEFIIAVFCCVDDWLKSVTQDHPIRRRGFAPSLCESEAITMEIVAEFQGIDADKAIWQYFHRHWQALFPRLKSRSSFVRQAANLWHYKQLLQERLAQELGAYEDDIHLIDGIPIPLCCFTRANRCPNFKGEADYGYCAAKDEIYYGFHGHLLISASGIITGFSLTPANGNEREALWDIIPPIEGLLIGDKGYLGCELAEALSQHNILLQTALRSNMKDSRDKAMVQLFQRVRRLIETVIAQLSERFHLEKVRARDMWHLTSRLNRKLLAHTVCFWLNRLSPDPLQFDALVSEN
jgi:Transposase DDE domain